MRKLKIQWFIEQDQSGNWEKVLSEKPYCITVSRDKMFGKNLIMFKYSQVDSDFNEPLVRELRGLVLDEDTLEPVVVPFFKFGNYGESYVPDIDWKTAFVSQKLDGCVHADTLVKTTKGDVKISDICKDHSKYQVLTFNHTTNEIEAEIPEAISVKTATNNWYELELEDGKKLKVTGNHRIWCKNLQCYRRVDELDGTEDLQVL